MQNRSYLFVPATRTDLINKAFASGADCVVIDWEDAVADQHKHHARQLLAAHDQQDGRKVWLRINGAQHAEYAADLAAVPTLSCLSGIILPKTETAAAVEHAAHTCRLPVLAVIESVRGWLNLPEIAGAEGLVALSYGCLDLANELNLSIGTPAAEQVFNRLRTDLLLHSVSHSLLAPVAAIYPDFQNDAGLEADITFWRDMGFGGMMCIHPKQVAAVHRLLHPSEAALAFARKVCHAADHSQQAAFQIDGKMIDAPAIMQARRLLAQYDSPTLEH